VSDAHLEKGIRRHLHQVSREVSRSGARSVFISPSETRGEWDLLVRGPFGGHMASFTEHADQLPTLVAEQLRTCLSDAVNAQLASCGPRR
jgi:hypothetical protein